MRTVSHLKEVCLLVRKLCGEKSQSNLPRHGVEPLYLMLPDEYEYQHSKMVTLQ
jgi:hypothetical protein